MENRFLKHPKFEALLRKLPMKKQEREVMYNPGSDVIITIFGMAGRGEYPIESILRYKDADAERWLIDILEYCLNTKIDILLEEKERQKYCSQDYMHFWVDYIGFREAYKYCKYCGKKR